MTGRLDGKVALVTGAGSIGAGWGNGKAAAILYAREGAAVFAVDISRDAAEETRSIIAGEGGDCVAHVADVSDRRQVEHAVACCLAARGPIDVLHNNVGITGLGGPEEIDEAEWDRVISVNLKSMYLTCRSVLPIMSQRLSGTIINISSIAATHSLGYSCISYSASKGAVNALTRDIALNYAPKGIRCNSILPGLMDTPLIHATISDIYGGRDEMVARRSAQCPMGFMGNAWDVAHAALYLATDESRYVTGIELVVDGGITLKVT